MRRVAIAASGNSADVGAPHEVRDGKEDYREFCIPAEVVNEFGSPRLVF